MEVSKAACVFRLIVNANSSRLPPKRQDRPRFVPQSGLHLPFWRFPARVARAGQSAFPSASRLHETGDEHSTLPLSQEASAGVRGLCCKDFALVTDHLREDEMTSQVTTWNRLAMNSAWALMSLPPMFRTCPFLIIAIAS
jgi:hypothetical protein